MSVRRFDLVLLVVSLVIAVGLCLWLFRPGVSLEGIPERLEAGDFEGAERQLLDYLAKQPTDRQARLILARAAVKRPDAKPSQALEMIAEITPRNRQEEAVLRSIEGEAHLAGLHYDQAENAWLDALALDPELPEVGWWLLDLYALQGRDEDTRRLALELFGTEPDPHDRVQLLLQAIRYDAHAMSPDWMISQLEPVVAANPADLPSTLALGQALIRNSDIARGLEILSKTAAQHAEDSRASEAYLKGLVDAGEIDRLQNAIAELPESFANDRCFDVARGWAASKRGDWVEAARCFQSAWEADPSDSTTAYRLRLALKISGQGSELEKLAPLIEATAEARDRLRVLYDTIDALPDLAASSSARVVQRSGDSTRPTWEARGGRCLAQPGEITLISGPERTKVERVP